MIHSLNSVICRIGVFLICARMLVHFRPNASYEKYLKLLMSLMILSQFMLPLANRYHTNDRTFLENDITNSFLDFWENTLETAMPGLPEKEQMDEQYKNSPVREVLPVTIAVEREGEHEGETISESVNR